jgi:hypothetical protein
MVNNQSSRLRNYFVPQAMDRAAVGALQLDASVELYAELRLVVFPKMNCGGIHS